MTTIDTRFPLTPRGATRDFEDTRPALYFAPDRWAHHLVDGHRIDRRAANDPARGAAPPVVVPLNLTRPRRRRSDHHGWSRLGLLSAVAVLALALLGAATLLLDAKANPRSAQAAQTAPSVAASR